MIPSNELLVAYNYDSWYGYNQKEPIQKDVTVKNNSHTLICGMSGSGKSYFTIQYIARIFKTGGNNSVVYFGDFKQDDAFICLRKCSRYYAYNKALDALNEVYSILKRRQSGEDKSRNQITFIWDEYMANILSLLGTEKKKGQDAMQKVSEILMIGRSLAVRLVIICQRPDALAFPTGARLNFGLIIVIGSNSQSMYSMVLPKEFIESIGSRKFGIGEGVMMWQGSELYFIKVPVIKNEDKMKEICIKALTK